MEGCPLAVRVAASSGAGGRAHPLRVRARGLHNARRGALIAVAVQDPWGSARPSRHLRFHFDSAEAGRGAPGHDSPGGCACCFAAFALRGSAAHQICPSLGGAWCVCGCFNGGTCERWRRAIVRFAAA
eukprot:160696-Prymnesium_polylepis.1